MYFLPRFTKCSHSVHLLLFRSLSLYLCVCVCVCVCVYMCICNYSFIYVYMHFIYSVLYAYAVYINAFFLNHLKISLRQGSLYPYVL